MEPQLTDAHMLALATFTLCPFASADEIAAKLALPVAVVLELFADLEAAGVIEPAPMQ